ncbi:MAG: PEP-CTERM sorting domain-containing protein [Bryobacteraceae bacterium]|jgi:hypothetical protein
MNKVIVCLFTLCLLPVVPASAGVVLYSNGPFNGTIGSWDITGHSVSDSFSISSAAIMAGFDFASWNTPGDVISEVTWSVGTTAFGSDLVSFETASVSAVFNFSNGSGSDIYTNTVSGLSVPLNAGPTYWLTLQNAHVSGGDPSWDQNNGPSTAWEWNGDAHTSPVGINSETFDILGGSSVPEPGTLGLLSGGILVMLGALRRRKIG